MAIMKITIFLTSLCTAPKLVPLFWAMTNYLGTDQIFQNLQEELQQELLIDFNGILIHLGLFYV